MLRFYLFLDSTHLAFIHMFVWPVLWQPLWLMSFMRILTMKRRNNLHKYSKCDTIVLKAKAGDLNITTHLGRLHCKSLIKQDMFFSVGQAGREMPELRNHHGENGEILQFGSHCRTDPNIPQGTRRVPRICLAVDDILFKQIALFLSEVLLAGQHVTCVAGRVTFYYLKKVKASSKTRNFI